VLISILVLISPKLKVKYLEFQHNKELNKLLKAYLKMQRISVLLGEKGVVIDLKDVED
jgi:hypothetical protein